MFKRKELAEIPNVKPIAAETKKQRAKEGKQRSKQLRRSAKQSEMNAAQSARSIKKRRAPEKAADCLQYERMYESGICEVEPGLFSMTMAFTDVNFQLARQEEQKSLFTQYSEFLNYFDPDTHLQISLVTRRVDEAEFRRDTFLPLRGDARDRYSEEMNRVISEKALQGQNGLIREKYITISLHEDDYRKAQVRLLKRAEDIQNLFKRMGSTVRRLSGIERLNLLHGITRPEEVMGFSYDWLLAEDSLTTKDFIAPSGYNWKPEHDDSRAVYNDRYQFGEPYNVGQYKDDIWEYVLNVGTDDSGAVRALSWQASPGSILYRRDLAKEVLGTDDPDEVSQQLNSNAAMLDAAAKFSEKGVKMFASWQDIMNMQFSNREQPWVVDDKLIIDDSMLEFMDMAKTISDNGYDLNVDPWAPEWSAAVESDDTFCYVLPTWGYQFVVKPAADKTKGQWGLCQGPVPYVKGGTWLGIYKDSPNKDLAWAFMQYVTCNSEAQQAYAKEYGEYVSLKSADQALAAEDGEEVLGGQNLYQFYNEQMEKIPADLMTAYDGQLNTFFLSDTKLYATGEMSKEEAIEQFKKDALNAYPELTVD